MGLLMVPGVCCCRDSKLPVVELSSFERGTYLLYLFLINRVLKGLHTAVVKCVVNLFQVSLRVRRQKTV